jgi:hypothetical protein
MMIFSGLPLLLLTVALSMPSPVWAASTEAEAVRSRLFPPGSEGARLSYERETNRYYVLVSGSNPFRESPAAVERRLNLRAKATLLRHLAGKRAGEKVIELSGWRTLGLWQAEASVSLLATVDKDQVALIDRVTARPAPAELPIL